MGGHILSQGAAECNVSCKKEMITQSPASRTAKEALSCNLKYQEHAVVCRQILQVLQTGITGIRNEGVVKDAC